MAKNCQKNQGQDAEFFYVEYVEIILQQKSGTKPKKGRKLAKLCPIW